MDDKIRIAVAGSCVTRNNFNSFFTDYRKNYSLVLEQYQTSLISIMAEPIQPPTGIYDGFEGFELRAMRGEVEKLFQQYLLHASPEVIIVDLYTDAMFGCVPFDGSYITMNRWRLKDKPVEQLLAATNPITPWDDHELFYELFTTAAEKFADLVAQRAPNAKIVLNSARAVQHWRSKEGNGAFADVTAFNERWERADRIFCEHVPCSKIDMPADVLSDGNHIHGRSNVHYERSYHDKFMRSLDEIALTHPAVTPAQTPAPHQVSL
ncbi:hypothetical protein GOL96_25720 [Sinorhizobium medicae]|nr:hypothetical protein [Sinorhizobium medicae]MDX1237215.1 hypothetical protein [Sinorhizobium medicae]